MKLHLTRSVRIPKRECVQTLTNAADLESDVSSGKRRHTGNFYVFKRVEEQGSPLLIERRSTEHPALYAQGRDIRGIPTVRTTSPGEEISNPLALPGKSHVAGFLQRDISAPNLVTVSQADGLSIRRPASAPRRFHLSRPATPSLPNEPTGSIHKRRRDGLAVFEERKEFKKLRVLATTSADSGSEADSLTMDAAPEQKKKKLKRPKVTEAEREWRKRAWAHNENQEVPSEKDSQVVNEMQAFAQEVKEKELQTASAMTAVEAYPPVTPPRGTKPLYKDRHPPKEPDVSDDDVVMDEDLEGDYVYDTYVRHLVPVSDMHTHNSIGHLVIPEEDQELWEAYIEEGEEDKEFETDDEDSNGKSHLSRLRALKLTHIIAEDYYGADYPEDEVDEDDEYDVNAYKYRKGASDDEEWDVDDTTWSDEETRKP